MGYNVFSMREHGGGGASEFKRAAKMAKEGIEIMCEFAEDMLEQFGERRGRRSGHESYGDRGGYGRRGGYARREDEYED